MDRKVFEFVKDYAQAGYKIGDQIKFVAIPMHLRDYLREVEQPTEAATPSVGLEQPNLAASQVDEVIEPRPSEKVKKEKVKKVQKEKVKKANKDKK